MTPLRTRIAVRAAACVAAALLASACDVNLGNGDFSVGMASGRASDTWDRTYTVSPGGRIELQNGNGGIEVTQASDGKVSVHAERIAKASSDEAAKQLLAKIEIVETVKPDAVRLETRAPKGFVRGGAEVKYSIKIPAGLALDVRNTNGTITLTGLANAIEASTTNGGIHGDGLAGTLSASTTNGGVDLALTKLGDSLTAETTNGGMSIQIPADSKADVTAHVVNGGISVENLKLETVGTQSRRRVEGRVNGGGARVELSTTNGGIHLAGK
jgi:putative adhesin